MRQILYPVLGVVMATPTAAEAQRQNDVISLRSALIAQSHGTGLRFRTDDGAMYGTSSYRVVGPALVVNDTVMPPMESVTHVWRRHNQAAKGAVIGGIFGGVLAGAVLGVMMDGLCDAADCRGAFIEGFGAGLGAGGVGGALLGAVIGVNVPGWKLVWQRNPGQSRP